MWPANQSRYRLEDPELMPLTECLKRYCTVKRVVPYWENEIVPKIREGKQILITAHGNSLRALIKHLDNISDADIVGFEHPDGNSSCL